MFLKKAFMWKRSLGIGKLYRQNCRFVVFKILSESGKKFYNIYENKNYDQSTNGESRVLKVLSAFNQSVVFDVGANIGNWSLLASKWSSDSTIYAFEPIKSSYKKLKELNLKNIKTFEYGLGQDDRELMFYDYGECSGVCSQYHSSHRKKFKKVKVKIVNGDRFCQDNYIDHLDFLKMDTEGSELDILKGFHQMLVSKKITAIQFEYGKINIVSKSLLVDFYNYLKPLGYAIGKIYPKTVDFRDYNIVHEDFCGPNFIAVKISENKIIQDLIRMK